MASVENILITGGSGFVGHHLLEFYKNTPYQIYSLSRKAPALHVRKKFPTVKFIQCDLSDKDKLQRKLKNISFEFVYHLAAQSIPSLCEEQPSETFRSNVVGTENLLSVLSQLKSKAKILFSSTNLVYGETFKCKKKLKEDDLTWPNGNYALSKLMAEKICVEYVERKELDIRIARAFNHFGPGQNQSLAFSSWISQLIQLEGALNNGKSKTLKTGNLTVQRDFLFVADVLNAYELILKKGKKGEIYNVCSSKPIKLGTYVQKLIQVSTIPSKLISVKQDKSLLRKNDFPVISGNNTKLRALGWRQKHDSLQALAIMLVTARD